MREYLPPLYTQKQIQDMPNIDLCTIIVNAKADRKEIKSIPKIIQLSNLIWLCERIMKERPLR